MNPIAANEEIYQLLREGYKYVTPDESEDDVTVIIIDWQSPESNDFLLCSQMNVTDEIETRRPDLQDFVNGLPLLFVELKASHRQLIHAYKDNLTDYRSTIPHLFVVQPANPAFQRRVVEGWHYFQHPALPDELRLQQRLPDALDIYQGRRHISALDLAPACTVQ